MGKIFLGIIIFLIFTINAYTKDPVQIKIREIKKQLQLINRRIREIRRQIYQIVHRNADAYSFNINYIPLVQINATHKSPITTEMILEALEIEWSELMEERKRIIEAKIKLKGKN